VALLQGGVEGLQDFKAWMMKGINLARPCARVSPTTADLMAGEIRSYLGFIRRVLGVREHVSMRVRSRLPPRQGVPGFLHHLR